MRSTFKTQCVDGKSETQFQILISKAYVAIVLFSQLLRSFSESVSVTFFYSFRTSGKSTIFVYSTLKTCAFPCADKVKSYCSGMLSVYSLVQKLGYQIVV